MTFLTRRQVAASIGAIAVALGCVAQQPNSQPWSTFSVTLTTATQFDPRWMGLQPNQPPGWEELNRSITGEFQQFSLRPVDDTEYRFGCNGCTPSTADLTVYAPGKFDPTEARKGRPVSVNADGDGFVVTDEAKHAAMLTWQYAENAWATVRSMTTVTVELDRMIELARALQPAERTPIRLPLSMAHLPDDLPLAQIDVDSHRDAPARLDYGTRIDFSCSGRTPTGVTRDCRDATNSLGVVIRPRDYRESTGGVEHRVVPMEVGGRDGLFDETINQVFVQLQPGMLAVFDVGGRGQESIRDVLASVEWAPDLDDQATWPAISDWTK